jgi:hypothetical protein
VVAPECFSGLLATGKISIYLRNSATNPSQTNQWFALDYLARARSIVNMIILLLGSSRKYDEETLGSRQVETDPAPLDPRFIFSDPLMIYRYPSCTTFLKTLSLPSHLRPGTRLTRVPALRISPTKPAPKLDPGREPGQSHGPELQASNATNSSLFRFNKLATNWKKAALPTGPRARSTCKAVRAQYYRTPSPRRHFYPKPGPRLHHRPGSDSSASRFSAEIARFGAWPLSLTSFFSILRVESVVCGGVPCFGPGATFCGEGGQEVGGRAEALLLGRQWLKGRIGAIVD